MSTPEEVAIDTPETTEQIVFNDADEFKIKSVAPDRVAQYDEFESDDDETAFGTTISDNDYMNKYKQHNRIVTKSNFNAGLLSPVKTKDSNKDNHINKEHVTFSPSTIDQEHQQRSITDNSTVHAMAQAAKYYNDLYDGADGGGQHMIQPSASNIHRMSFAGITDKFESRQLEYGQSALFDRTNEQYFADIANGEKRRVLINLHVSRITEIDTVKERFRCQFWISFSWLPTYAEWINYKEYKVKQNIADWEPDWVPIIAFPELIREWTKHFAEKPNSGRFAIGYLHGKENEIGYDPTYCKFIRCKLECDMTFSTGFLLLNFPVDCQDLPISIHETSGGCIFVAEKRKRSFASIHTISSVMEEWEFLNMMIEIGQLITGSNESSLAQLKVRLKMQRRFEVYLWNVVFFMALISGLSLCSFAVEEVDLGERLAIIITLLLTSVAYQSAVFSTLPNVPYLTLLDKYIVSSFVFMTLVTILTAMLGTKYLDNDEHNKLLFMITSLIFIGYHIIFCIVAIKKKKFETKKLYMSSKAMLQLYAQSRERMEVEWKSEREIGSNWKIYTKYPKKLITTSRNGQDMYATKKNSMRSKTNIF